MPAVNGAFHKAFSLDDLQRPHVVEIGHLDIPGPAAAAETKRLIGLDVGRNTILYTLRKLVDSVDIMVTELDKHHIFV